MESHNRLLQQPVVEMFKKFTLRRKRSVKSDPTPMAEPVNPPNEAEESRHPLEMVQGIKEQKKEYVSFS
jgi:hypothetical protein